LFEGLLALVILSILGLAIINGVIQVNKLLFRSEESAVYTARILIMDNYLRKVIDKINFPFWLNSVEIEENTDSVRIPYLYGEENNILLIYTENHHLYVKSELTEEYSVIENEYDINNVFGPFDSLDLSLDENNIQKYISVTVTDNNREPVRIDLGFSSFILSAGAEE
jgi:hypothetical protein